jgi:hypothetical protein
MGANVGDFDWQDVAGDFVAMAIMPGNRGAAVLT